LIGELIEINYLIVINWFKIWLALVQPAL